MQPVSVAAIAVIVLATAYGFVRKAPLSLIYAVAILAVFALQVSSSALGFVRLSPVTFELGLFTAPGLPPAPWSWITFEFVHASETHIFLNLLGLILISPTLEERIGSVRWAMLFFVGGAAGALVFLLVHFGDVVLLVGASAGIFAVFGAYGRLYPRDRIALFLPIPGIPTLPVVEVVVIFLVLETLLGLLGPLGIAWEAHVGALIFGFAASPLFMRLPLRGGRGRLIPVKAIRDLATTPELQRILREAERADLPETRQAWIESFVGAARCPRCGGPLQRRFGRIVSDCGWRRRL